jgi:hypothetical protein
MPRYRGVVRVAALLLAALAFASVSAATATSVPASGLRGVLLRYLPVCTDDDCTAPAPGVALRFNRLGTVVARVTTGPAGGYVVRLRPGVYTVTTPAARIGRELAPRRVTVPVGRMARVDFHLATGVQ